MKIREGTKEDLPRVLELVHELAQYEKQPDEVTNTLERMEKDGFGPKPVYAFFVVEMDDQIVGLSLYYYRYSTWKGKRMYMEDIVVTEEYRGKGVGKLLFDTTIDKAKEENCTGMMWQVLDWNEPAIEFYKTYLARMDPGWLNCHIDF